MTYFLLGFTLQSASAEHEAKRLGVSRVWLFAAAYLGCIAVGEWLSFPNADYWPFWPSNGLLLGALLVTERRHWLVLCGATLPASLAANVIFHGTGDGNPYLIGVAAGYWLANTLEPLLAAWLLRRYVAERMSLLNVREFLALLAIGAGTAPAVGATIGATAMCLLVDGQSFGDTWLRWWIGDAIGVMIVAPVVITWQGASRSPRILRRPLGYYLEFVVYCVALIVMMERAFHGHPGDDNLALRFPFFLVTPFMLWAGFRFEPRGAALCVLLLSLIIVWCTTRGFGVISQSSSAVTQQGILLQALLVQASSLTLLFSSSIECRELFEARLQQESHNLARSEFEVRRQKDLLQSILDSMAEAVIVIDAEGRFVQFNPAAYRLHQRGPEPIPPEKWPEAYRIFLADGVTPCPTEQMPGMRALQGENCDGIPIVIRHSEGLPPVYARASARPIRAADGTITGAVIVRTDVTALVQAEREQAQLIDRLQQALSEIKTLRGLIPMCASCKKILNDAGAWERLESYLRTHAGTEFTHGICPDCGVELYGDVWHQAMQDTADG